MTKVVASDPSAEIFVRETLSIASGLGRLIASRAGKQVFFFADRETREDDTDYQHGRLYSKKNNDAELKAFAEDLDESFVAIFHDPWSQVGDMEVRSWNFKNSFLYEGHYYHIAEEPGTLPLLLWRNVAISALSLIYLISVDLRSLDLVHDEARAHEIGEQTARQLADGVRFAFVSAFDQESWMGVEFQA